MRRWRLSTKLVLAWSYLFPIALIAFIAIVTRDDGASLRYLDVAFVSMVGAVIWGAGTIVGSIVWLVNDWLVDRRRRPDSLG